MLTSEKSMIFRFVSLVMLKLNSVLKIEMNCFCICSAFVWSIDISQAGQTIIQGLFSPFTACGNQLTFFKIFSNFTHFCPNFQIFCPPLLILTCLCHCCPFFWKIACMPLLSKIGPDHHGINLFYLSLIFFPRLEEYTDLLTRKSLPHRNFPWLNQNWGRCLFYSNIITIK